MGLVHIDTSTDPHVGFRPPGDLDVATALEPYAGHFGVRHAAHLLRRAGFGGGADEVARLATLDAAAAVAAFLHPDGSDEAFPDYPAAAALYNVNRGQATVATEAWWLDRMLRTRRPLVEKMTLFWHGHFATSIRKVPPPLMARQIDLFRSLGLGNFRTLLGAVAVDPAMSIWLDNRFNAKAHPNENFARELMELFTLGLGAYTESDVKEAARALTGWPYDGKTMTVVFRPALHDDGPKMILGQTGPFGLDDVLHLLVSQPVHQRFLARKLLEFFVYSDPEPELVEALAQTYALAGFDIAKTVGTILRSNVFYSPRAYRALPKSPLEFVIGLLRFSGASAVPPAALFALRRMGQEPLAPPSVKGWDGGPAWINTSTLLTRFNFVNALMATARAPRAAGDAAPNVQPDAIVRQAGGMDAQRVVAAIVAGALQDDVTSDVRATLTAFLNSSGAAPAGSAANVLPFGPENYQEKIRGALALALNLPVNQLN